MSDSDEDTYAIPLQDQRVFGAGIKRKRITFVPASENGVSTPRSSTASNAADVYLSIVMKSAVDGAGIPEGNTRETRPSEVTSTASATPEPRDSSPSPALTLSENDAARVPICEVCHLPINPPGLDRTPHEASLAHQLSLQHAHPPSAIDRSRKGLPILQARGWDPDSRVGLGARGEGILHPIKPKPKNDTAGLGLDLKSLKKAGSVQKAVEKKLNAKEVREKVEEDKKKAKVLERMFNRNDDVEKYLGPEGVRLLELDKSFDVRRGKKKKGR